MAEKSGEQFWKRLRYTKNCNVRRRRRRRRRRRTKGTMFENPPLSSARQVLLGFPPNRYESLYLDK